MSWKAARFSRQIEEVGRLLDLVTTIGPTRVPVLVLGPRSSAVDLVAEALHACSPREARPFVTVRCGLYPAATLERELFIRRRSPDSKSAIESANGGTLFIEQIQHTPSSAQAELLRLLDDSEFIEPAAGVSHKADVRIIASAGSDLRERADRGRFLPALFARLGTVSLELKRGYTDKRTILDVVDHLRIPQSDCPNHLPEVAALHQALVPEPADASAETALFAALRRIGHDKAQVMARRNIEAVTSAVERCVETYECFGGNLYEQLNRQLQKTLIRRVMLQCNGAPAVAAAVLGISQVLLESKLLEFGIG